MSVFVHSVFSLRNKGTFPLRGKCEGGDKWEGKKAQKERGGRRCLLTIFQRSEIVPLLSSPLPPPLLPHINQEMLARTV